MIALLMLASGCLKDPAEESAGRVSITPYYLLNEGGHETNSHATRTGNSSLTYVGGSCVLAGVESLDMDMPVYPRFLKTKDGRYLMFYHSGVYNPTTGVSSWAGRYCYVAQSSDLRNWSFSKKLFTIQSNVQSAYGDRLINRTYSGAYPARMADGNIIVASAYIGNYDPRHRMLDNGIAIRISSDEGESWSMERRLNVGTNWEPCVQVLPADSPHPGRVIIYYTDSCPYIDAAPDAWSKDIISTGVSYIYSDDNGKTWKPEDLLGNHLHAYRYLRDSNAKWKVYSDQMPCVIQLGGSSRLVGVSECDQALCSSSSTDYWVGVSYGEKDGSWGTPDADEVMPSEKYYGFKGCGPGIHQFASGETIVTYNYNVDKNGNRLLMRMADETAHNFGEEIRVFEDCELGGYGFWGESLIDNHILVAAVGGRGGDRGKGYKMQIGQYYLNHDISAASRKVKVDGSSSEWQRGDEALFAGSNGNCHATLRFSVSSDTLYCLVEVDASGSDASDCVNVYFADADRQVLASGDLWLKFSADGSSRVSRYNGKAWFTEDASVVSKTGYGDNCYIAEFSLRIGELPLSSSSSSVKLNFSCSDSVDGLSSIRSVTDPDTSVWIKLNIR